MEGEDGSGESLVVLFVPFRLAGVRYSLRDLIGGIVENKTIEGRLPRYPKGAFTFGNGLDDGNCVWIDEKPFNQFDHFLLFSFGMSPISRYADFPPIPSRGMAIPVNSAGGAGGGSGLVGSVLLS